MEYKVGDKIKIREDRRYYEGLEILLKKINRIATIKKIVKNNYYILEETPDIWFDHDIEGLVLEPETATARFELMDFE